MWSGMLAESIELSPSITAHMARVAPMLTAIRLASGGWLTGLLWSPDLIVTADRLLPRQEAYPVLLAGGQMAAAVGFRRSPELAVAGLKLVGTAPTVPIEAADLPNPGAVLLVIGAGEDAAPIARLTTAGSPSPALSAPPGYLPEGGAVVNEAGALVGLCLADIDGIPSIMPRSAIARWLQEPAGTAVQRRGWLGAALQPISIPAILAAAAGQPTGRLVLSLVPNAPAARAGVRPGDILLGLGGAPMNGPGSLRTLLGRYQIGATADLRLMRDGRIRTLPLVVQAQPSEA